MAAFFDAIEGIVRKIIKLVRQLFILQLKSSWIYLIISWCCLHGLGEFRCLVCKIKLVQKAILELHQVVIVHLLDHLQLLCQIIFINLGHFLIVNILDKLLVLFQRTSTLISINLTKFLLVFPFDRCLVILGAFSSHHL